MWANGITLFKAREEAVKLYGAEQKKKAIKLYGKRNAVSYREPPPLTESAQRALDWAFDKKLKSGQFLLHLWSFYFLLVGSHSMLLQAQAIHIVRLVGTLNISLGSLGSNLFSNA